jgi:hypothetical protein
MINALREGGKERRKKWLCIREENDKKEENSLVVLSQGLGLPEPQALACHYS